MGRNTYNGEASPRHTVGSRSPRQAHPCGPVPPPQSARTGILGPDGCSQDPRTDPQGGEQGWTQGARACDRSKQPGPHALACACLLSPWRWRRAERRGLQAPLPSDPCWAPQGVCSAPEATAVSRSPPVAGRAWVGTELPPRHTLCPGPGSRAPAWGLRTQTAAAWGWDGGPHVTGLTAPPGLSVSSEPPAFPSKTPPRLSIWEKKCGV